eukprot:s1437_g17.t2
MLLACLAAATLAHGSLASDQTYLEEDACLLQLNVNVTEDAVNGSAWRKVEAYVHSAKSQSAAGSVFSAWQAPSPSDQPHAFTAVFFFSVGCASAVLWALEMCRISCAQSRRAGQCTYLATSFLISVSHSLLLTVSLPLARELGFSAASSGILSSCPCLGGLLAQWCVATFGTRAMLTTPQAMRSGAALGVFLQAMAYIGFVVALFLPSDVGVWFLLIFFRSLGGFFGGLGNLAASWLAFEMTPEEELMDMQTTNQACFGLGHCMGGVVSSLALVLFHLSGTEQSSEQIRQAGAAPAMLFIAVNVFLLAMLVLLVPRRLPESMATKMTAAPAVEDEKEKSSADLALKLDDSDRHLVFRTGVIYNFERSFSVGAIEVATTMISEVEFGFSPLTTGWIFGCIALGSAVANIIVFFTPANIDSRSTVMLWQAGAGLLMSPFILDWWPWWSLYVADVLILTLTNAANGIADGLAILAASSQNQDGVSRQSYINQKMMSMGASRLIAAPFARGTIANLGRNGYGALQSLVTLLGFYGVWKMYCAVARRR